MEVKGPGGAWHDGAAFNHVAGQVLLRVQPGAEVQEPQKDLELSGLWQPEFFPVTPTQVKLGFLNLPQKSVSR